MPIEKAQDNGTMPKQVLVLVGGKLIGLDTILPFALQLTRECPELKVVFLFLNARHIEHVNLNYVLKEGMASCASVRFLSSGGGALFSRAAAGFRLLGWALRTRMRPTLLLTYFDLADFPAHVLARAARGGGGQAAIYHKTAYPVGEAYRWAVSERVKASGRQGQNERQSSSSKVAQIFRDSGDFHLLYHPGQAADTAQFLESPPVNVGSPRKFPAWLDFLDRMFQRHGVRDVSGARIEPGELSVFVLFYPGNVVIPTLRTDARTQTLAWLSVLKEELPSALVIVKPHPNCSLGEVEELFGEAKGIDYKISYAHPQLLGQVATAAVLPNGSNVMADMFADGVRVLDISDYCPEVESRGGALFLNQGRIACRTEKEMRAALRALAAKPDTLPRSNPDELVWPKPDSLAAALMNSGRVAASS